MFSTSKQPKITSDNASDPIGASKKSVDTDFIHYQSTGSARTIARSCGLLSFFNKKDSKYRRKIRYIVYAAVVLPRTASRFHALRRVDKMNPSALHRFAAGLAFALNQNPMGKPPKNRYIPEKSGKSEVKTDPHLDRTSGSGSRDFNNTAAINAAMQKPEVTVPWGIRLKDRTIAELQKEVRELRGHLDEHGKFVERTFHEKRDAQKRIDALSEMYSKIPQSPDAHDYREVCKERDTLLQNNQLLREQLDVGIPRYRESQSELAKAQKSLEETLQELQSEKSEREKLTVKISQLEALYQASLVKVQTLTAAVNTGAQIADDEAVIPKKYAKDISRALQTACTVLYEGHVSNNTLTRPRYDAFVTTIVRHLSGEPETSTAQDALGAIANRKRDPKMKYLEYSQIIKSAEKLVPALASGVELRPQTTDAKTVLSQTSGPGNTGANKPKKKKK